MRASGRVAAGMAAVLLSGVAWADGDAVEVLGKTPVVRAYFGFKTPVVLSADGEVRVPLMRVGQGANRKMAPLPAFETPLPPAEWTQPAFDDASWPRFDLRLPLEVGNRDGRSVSEALGAAENHLICVRARFRLADPTDGVKVIVEYVGGAVVCVNGHEVARGHLPAGDLKPDTPAEPYPDNLCVGSDGVLIYATRDGKEKKAALLAARYRRLADVAVPKAVLRAGDNVLTIEIHRAPANEGTFNAKRPPVGGMSRVYGLYAYAGLKSVSLTAPASAAAPQAAAVHVWRPGRVETVRTTSRGVAADPPQTMQIAGVRNGVFSDRLVVSSGSAAPVKGLRAAVSPLTGAGRTFPADAVSVRYAAPFDTKKAHGPATMFDALVEAPPAAPTVPIWVLARIPAEAAPGTYTGTVTVEADGLEKTVVPIRLTVHDWRLPDPADWTVRNVGQSMTEHLAEFYGVPRWSEKHFDLIARSMALMAQINDRSAIVDLTIPGNYAFDNTETMVRWVRQADGTYTYDFTVFDKYLDTVQRVFRKPLPVRINIFTQIEEKDGKRMFKGGRQVCVSLLDPDTGKIENLESPPMGTPESLPFWKPVLDAVRKRIEARGWWDVTGVADTQYAGGPDSKSLKTLKAIWPDLKGISQQHGLARTFREGVPVIVAGTVWNEGRLRPRGYRGLWKKGRWLACCGFARNRHGERAPLVVYRSLPEEMIMRHHHGVFPLGEDLWALYRANGRRWNVSGTSALGPGCSTKALLAPGPDGALPTERFEMVRESTEACEAILYLDRGLAEGRITGDLAGRVNRALDTRSDAFLRFHKGMSFGYPGPYNDKRVWQALQAGLADDDATLFALCAEAAGRRDR